VKTVSGTDFSHRRINGKSSIAQAHAQLAFVCGILSLGANSVMKLNSFSAPE